MAARGRRGTFAFDLSHPAKKGVLLKQGAFHKAFKYRFFLVYPGFLVYYEQESKWLLDLTKGETLGGRLGAIKLRNGSCNVARNAPKACKFGFIVHAPDPVNKRQSYLINATSKQDRDEWIEAIRKSTPVSPQQKRRNESSPKGVKEEPKKPEKEAVPRHPVSPVRQDTAAEAAAAVTESERLGGIDQSVTSSVTSSIDESLQPTMDIRRDTAATAALSVTRRPSKEINSITEDSIKDTSIDDVLGPQAVEEKESDHSDEDSLNTTSPANSSVQSPEPDVEQEPEVEQKPDTEPEPEVEREPEVEEKSDVEQKSEVERESDTGPEPSLVNGIAEEAESPKTEVEVEEKREEGEKAVATENTTTEDADGERGESATDSSPVQSNETVENHSDETVEKQSSETVASEIVEKQSTETVESQSNQNGPTEVVTSVTIECTGEANSACNENGCRLDKSKEATPTKEGEGEKEESANGEKDKEGDKTEGDDDRGLEVSTSEVLLTQERSNSFSVTVNNIDTDDYSSSEDEGTELPPPPPPADDTPVANGTSETPEVASEKPEVTSSEATPKENGDAPAITVENPEENSGEVKENGSAVNNGEGEKLVPLVDKRRPSQVFIDKKGFLYKMGGKRKNWNLRYFVLQPGVFTYSKNPSSKILGEVKLKNLQVFFPGIGERKTSFQFTIHTESTWNKRMDWVLAAQSEREMKDWITAFKLAGQKNTPTPSPAISDNELGSSS